MIRFLKKQKDLQGVTVGFVRLRTANSAHTQELLGIIKDNKYIYYKSNNDERNTVEKCSLSANQVESLRVYNSYCDLVKDHIQFSNKLGLLESILTNS